VFAAIAGLALTTQIVLLGTGNSRPVPGRSGRATAIVVSNQTYLVDFGSGVVQRAAVAHRSGLAALDPAAIKHAFATNLQPAHTAGYPDLVFTPSARQQELQIYGPPGIRKMTEHVLAAWAVSGRSRRVDVHESASGTVHRDAKVTVTAFSNGYRFQTVDRRIVISSDPDPGESVVEHCNGCDVLIHEVSMQSVRRLADVASRARPQLLVLHPAEGSSEADLVRELRTAYRGRFVVGHDLDVL
jgi:ribonuclease BN (tRNA processing enzyme)